MQRAAVIVSAIFHPLLMPLASLYLATQADWYIRGMMQSDQVYLVLIVVALSTVAFPGINVLLLRWYGVLHSLEMPNRKERYAPFLSTLFFFILGYYLLRKGSLPTPFYSIYFGCILALVIVTLINFRWKISVHATGIAGLVGSMVGLFHLHGYAHPVLISVLILITGAVLSARLILKAHTPAQAYVGAVVGFLSVYLPVVQGYFI